MGKYWSAIQRDVSRVKRGPKKHSSGSVITEADLGINLERMSLALREKAMPAAVRAAGAIVKAKALDYIKIGRPAYPGRSKITGTRYKWSKPTARKRGGYEGAPSMARKKDMLNRVKKKDYNAYAVVGPRYGKAIEGGHNQAHILEEGTSNHYWWGKKASRALQARPFLEPAGYRTIGQQVQAMKAKLANYKKY